MTLFKHRPSPAMIVALLGVFLGLGGVGLAANGQSLILGQGNSATAQTGLSSNTSSATFAVTNSSTGSPLKLQGPTSKPPLIVNSQTKVAGLNVDKLDGIDSSGFVQGGGMVVSNHIVLPDDGAFHTILGLPGLGTLKAVCNSTGPSSALGYFSSVALTDITYEEVGFEPVTFQSTILTTAGTTSARRTFLALDDASQATGRVTSVAAFEFPGTPNASHCFYQAYAQVNT